MKLGNFASLDPAMMGKGLKSVSEADRVLIETFLKVPEETIIESENAYAELVSPDIHPYGFSEEAAPFYVPDTQTEKMSLVKTRMLQTFFRNTVVSSYKNHCAVCETNVPELLIASHIIPWSKDEKLRLLPTNGICLCASHDRAFDRGLISIEDDYKISLSQRLKKFQNNKYVDLMFFRFNNQSMKLPFRFLPDKSNLDWHRKNVFQR